MKNILSKTLLSYLFVNVVYIAQSVAATLVVCSTCEITSIHTAIEIAAHGDILIIKKGVYREGQIVVDKSLTIRGEDYPILDGESDTEIMTITAHNVTIEGLHFQNVGTSYMEDRAAIRAKRVHNFLIQNNIITNAFFGVYLEHSRNGKVVNNIIRGEAQEEMSSGNAIHIWYCKNVIIEGNKLSHHRDGIYLEFVDNSRIVDNISEYNIRYGLHFMFSDGNDFSYNIFQYNGSGVAVMFSKEVNMWNNRFQNNWGKASYGLLLKEIYDTEIRNNIFLENTTGIFVEGSTRVSYIQNELSHNGWAMKIMGGCLDNAINQNNFIGNTFDLSVNNNINENNFDGNYWSEYSGYDLDNDGIGDVPYRPVKLFNFIVNQTPEALVLMRSPFVDLINFSERVSPIFTPKNVLDHSPLMKYNKNKTNAGNTKSL
ncbi:MAG: nitrous oxide reductase family maturation protein NosD [Saprospiraceae bacterium]